MAELSRASFFAGASSLAISSLAAGPAQAAQVVSAPSSIRDIEHIVIFMQENRSFDH